MYVFCLHMAKPVSCDGARRKYTEKTKNSKMTDNEKN